MSHGYVIAYRPSERGLSFYKLLVYGVPSSQSENCFFFNLSKKQSLRNRVIHNAGIPRLACIFPCCGLRSQATDIHLHQAVGF